MSRIVREALEGALCRARQAEYDARYALEKEREREKRRDAKIVDLEFALVGAEADAQEAKSALDTLGYSYEEPSIAVGVSAQFLSDEELGQ